MLLTWATTSLYQAVLGLFSSGAQGVFLDANDWGPTGTNGTGVVFQDAASTSVSAMEQPVQVILDKSLGLARGAEIITNAADRNFTSNTGYWTLDAGIAISGNACNWTGQIQGAGFYKPLLAVAGNYYEITYTIGTLSAGGLRAVVSGSANGTTRTSPGTYTDRIFCTLNTYIGVLATSNGTVGTVTSISIKPIAGNHAYVPASANRPTISARYNLLLATAALSTQSVTVGAGSYTLYFTGSGSVALSGASSGTKTAGSSVITCTAGTLTLTVTGSVLTADLRPSDQATGLIPQYQAIVTATNYDQSPVWPVLIKGNGSNQYLTGNLDLSGTNKVTVWAGVRKTSDAAIGMIAELSTNSGGSRNCFGVSASGQASAGAKYGGNLSGTSSNTYFDTPASFAAPVTNVVTTQFDTTQATNATQQIMRVNAVQATLTFVGTPVSGSMGNYPYYVLSRAGSSLFMNGGFNTIIILGAAATAAQISTTEAWANSKVRAY